MSLGLCFAENEDEWNQTKSLVGGIPSDPIWAVPGVVDGLAPKVIQTNRVLFLKKKKIVGP